MAKWLKILLNTLCVHTYRTQPLREWSVQCNEFRISMQKQTKKNQQKACVCACTWVRDLWGRYRDTVVFEINDQKLCVQTGLVSSSESMEYCRLWVQASECCLRAPSGLLEPWRGNAGKRCQITQNKEHNHSIRHSGNRHHNSRQSQMSHVNSKRAVYIIVRWSRSFTAL